MRIRFGAGKTEHGTGISIKLTGREVAMAIVNYVSQKGVYISGPRTVRVNGELCGGGHIYVDPFGFVLDGDTFMSGRGVGLPVDKVLKTDLKDSRKAGRE